MGHAWIVPNTGAPVHTETTVIPAKNSGHPGQKQRSSRPKTAVIPAKNSGHPGLRAGIHDFDLL
jgi:hypothetical protein